MNSKWIYADWRLPNDRNLQLIQDLGFTDVVLGMVLPREPEFRPSFSTNKIITAANDLTAIGVRVHIMAWVYRQKTFIRDCADWMVAICKETNAASGLLDAEKDWHKGYGISANDAAKLVQQEFADLPCKLGVTGLSQLHSTVAPLLDVCDYGIPQAYSIWKPRTADHWSHSKATEPGDQQLDSWKSWCEAGKPLVMGLSNYWAQRPARFGLPRLDTRESLERSLEGARKAGAREVAYWSLKWLQGTGKNRQIAREVIKAIPIESPDEVIPCDMNQPSAIQWLLVMNGFDIGKFGPERNGIDGIWGKRSQQGLDEFRRARGSALTGPYTLDDATALINCYRAKTR